MQLAVVQIKAARVAQAAQEMWTVCKVMNMTFLAARSAGCARTMDTGQQDCPEARKAD